MPVNLKKLIEILSRDRYMGALIFGEAGGERGVGKTAYLTAFQAAHPELHALYLDVQQRIQEQGNPQIVFELNPHKFLEWCLAGVPKEGAEAPDVVLIDNFDVIVNLWDDRTREEFLNRLQRLELAVFPKPVVAMAQTDAVFQQAYEQQKGAVPQRVIAFSELEAV